MIHFLNIHMVENNNTVSRRHSLGKTLKDLETMQFGGN